MTKSILKEKSTPKLQIKHTRSQYLKEYKGPNYNFIDSIKEFIDNSFDANASNVHIKWCLSKNHKSKDIKLYDWYHEDDGDGMTYPELLAAINMGHENEEDTMNNPTTTGYYGMGMTTGLLHLQSLNYGTANVHSTKGNKGGWISLDWSTIPDYDADSIKSFFGEKDGTKITWVGEGTKQTIPLINELSETYFPGAADRYELGKEFNIVVQGTDNKEHSVIFVDNFYREEYVDIWFERRENKGLFKTPDDLKNHIRKHIKRQTIPFSYKGIKLELEAVYIEPGFRGHHQGEQSSKTKKGQFPTIQFANNKSGIYISTKDRYIHMGDGEFIFKEKQYEHSNLRLFLTVSKEIYKYFCQSQKSNFSSKNFRQDPEWCDGNDSFKSAIRQAQNWASSQKPKKNDSTLQEKINELIVPEVDNIVKGLPGNPFTREKQPQSSSPFYFGMKERHNKRNDGSYSVEFELYSQKIDDGTTVGYQITGVESKDIDNYPTQGNFVIDNNKSIVTFVIPKTTIDNPNIKQLSIVCDSLDSNKINTSCRQRSLILEEDWLDMPKITKTNGQPKSKWKIDAVDWEINGKYFDYKQPDDKNEPVQIFINRNHPYNKPLCDNLVKSNKTKELIFHLGHIFCDIFYLVNNEWTDTIEERNYLQEKSITLSRFSKNAKL